MLVENTPGLFARGFDRVLWDLAALGFDAEWTVLSSCRFGAPHTRERVFVVAYADRISLARVKCGRVFGAIDGLEKRNLHQQRTCDEPPRMADGVSNRMDYAGNRGIGNAVDPRVAEFVGERLRLVL